MAHKLPRLSKSLLDKPQLITASKFQEISELLEDRNNGLYQAAVEASKIEASHQGSQTGGLVGDTVGVLRVEGPTTYKASGWEALCGGTSYVGLLDQMSELVQLEDVDTILMMVDSSGGEAYRMMNTATELRRMADDSGKRLVGYVDGIAASAGYGLLSACHEVIANPDAQVGSIGVVIALQNNSEQLKNEGIERKFITAGASKVPFEDDGSFREGFLEDLQSSVTELYDNFVDHVAGMRGIDEQVVRDTEAKMFRASAALEIGLVDAVMEEAQFYEHLADSSAGLQDSSSDKSNTITIPKKTQEEKLMSDPEQVALLAEQSAALATMQEQMKAQADLIASFQAKELAVEKDKLSAQLDSAPFLVECKEDLVSFLMDADVSDKNKELMNVVIASAQASYDVVTEKAATDVAEAQASVEEANAKVEQANADKEAIKEEFGKTEHSVSAELKEEAVGGGNVLAAKIEAKKAKLAAK